MRFAARLRRAATTFKNTSDRIEHAKWLLANRAGSMTMIHPPIELMASSATLIGNSIGERAFRNTRVDSSEPAHNTFLLRSSATNRLTITPAYHGSELEWSVSPQIFRV
jgi:hypothetical protein